LVDVMIVGRPGNYGGGEVAVRQELGGGWFAIYHLGEGGITHIDIQRSDRFIERRWPRGHGKDVGQLHARALRQVRPGAALAAGRAGMKNLQVEAAWLGVPPLTESTPRLRRLAALAAYYVEALNRGSRSPIVDVANKVDRDPKQVRDDLHAARREELLTPTGRGTAGGELTTKAKALLKENEA